MAKRSKSKAKEAGSGQEEQPRAFSWIPLWGWALLFLVPLIFSEYMFYRIGRGMSMIVFPIAWVAFWVTMMHRGGWPIFRKRKDN
ncbi:MAG: hypothetical protein JSW37_03110 [Anaerolineales bacterium]|nr:MAG: hypothetical protein JSW37_03110 [Anaerolineales bacterium]